MGIFSNAYHEASSLLSQGRSENNPELILKGAEIIVTRETSEVYYLLEGALNGCGPQVASGILDIIQHDFKPVSTMGEGSETSTLVNLDAYPMLSLLTRSSDAAPPPLKKKYASVIEALEAAIKKGKRSQREESAKRPFKPIDWDQTRVCIHICQRCSSGCPLSRPHPDSISEDLEKALKDNDIRGICEGAKRLISERNPSYYHMIERALENPNSTRAVLGLIQNFRRVRGENVFRGTTELIEMLNRFAAKNFGNELGTLAKNLADKFDGEVKGALALRKGTLKG